MTSLYGGKRVPKDNLRIKAYGTIDELNSAIGVLLACLGSDQEIAEFFKKIQHDLLNIGSYLAGSQVSLVKISRRVIEMEGLIDRLDGQLPPLKNFILPSGSLESSLSHLVRAVGRRAEREVVTLLDEEKEADKRILRYLNRLSDLIFVVARYLNKQKGNKDVIWKGSRNPV